MAKISFIRIDYRLIHGQVVGRWLQQTDANRIIIVNDILAKDEFMASIYAMAAPPGISVDVFTEDQAIEKWEKDQFGEGKVFLLFKDVGTTYRMHKRGFPLIDVQIGGLGSGPDRKNVFGPITLNGADVKLLKEISEDGIRVYLHQVPDEPSMELEKVLEKHSFED